MAMIISTVKVMPVGKCRPDTLELLSSVQGPILAQPGCIGCWIYHDKAEHALIFWGEWQTDAALHRHICSDLYRRVLLAMELSSERPEVCFHQIEETRGLDLIHELREGGGEGMTIPPAMPRTLTSAIRNY